MSSTALSNAKFLAATAQRLSKTLEAEHYRTGAVCLHSGGLYNASQSFIGNTMLETVTNT
eukprot:scaffold626667_cov46-Prasinocladus_malaysianus.AAC.1